MKRFNNINFKKLIPGILSFVIVAGMGISTFATSVDPSIFVNKERHLTKYYEFEWRVKEVQNYLDRLYKFSCTNLKSFAGASSNSQGGSVLFNYYDYTSSLGMRPWPHVDLSEKKYLRYNYKGALYQNFAHPSNVHSWRYKRPASMFKWRPGVELYPTTTVTIDFTRSMPSSTTWQLIEYNSSITLTMGPFKKFPRITSTGSTLTGGYICEFPDYPMLSSLYPAANAGYYKYAYGTETLPTTWYNENTMRAYVGSSQTASGPNYNTYTQYKVADIKDQFDTTPYGFKNSIKPNYIHNLMYVNGAAPGIDFSQYEDFWLRVTYTEAGPLSAVYNSNLGDMDLLTWNNNKSE